MLTILPFLLMGGVLIALVGGGDDSPDTDSEPPDSNEPPDDIAPYALQRGTDENDYLAGDEGADRLIGQAGDDVLVGKAGDDQLVGWTGHDDLLGGAGDDELSGGFGADELLGGSGNDTLLGGVGKDILSGGTGSDVIYGGPGDDHLHGINLYNDETLDALTLNPDDDDIWPYSENAANENSGSDTLIGGTGDDWILLGSGDVAQGGEGMNDYYLGDWMGADNPAEISDFDPIKDALVYLYDPELDGPDIEVVYNGYGDASVTVDDILIANLKGDFTEANLEGIVIPGTY